MPTVSEAALKGYEASSWWGVLAPGRTPLEVIDKLHADIVSVLQLPETRSRITGLGGEPVGNTPREFVALLHEELGKWAKVIKDANIKID